MLALNKTPRQGPTLNLVAWLIHHADSSQLVDILEAEKVLFQLRSQLFLGLKEEKEMMTLRRVCVEIVF